MSSPLLSCPAKAEHPVNVKAVVSRILDHPPSRMMTVKLEARPFFTSPRVRGEVARRSPKGEGAAGEGDYPQTESMENPPHPNPLPARGDREQSGAQ
jgi:DNA helicase-2/ATP-dependent DNA helicase PcrA